jgi:hypothetical protein
MGTNKVALSIALLEIFALILAASLSAQQSNDYYFVTERFTEDAHQCGLKKEGIELVAREKLKEVGIHVVKYPTNNYVYLNILAIRFESSPYCSFALYLEIRKIVFHRTVTTPIEVLVPKDKVLCHGELLGFYKSADIYDGLSEAMRKLSAQCAQQL